MKQITDYFNLNLPQVTNSDVALTLARKTITGQSTQLKQSLLHCLNSKRSLCDYPMRERSQEFLGRPNGRILKPKSRKRRRRKRRRRRRPRQPFAPVPSPSTAPTPIWTPNGAPSPTMSPEGTPRDELPAPYPSMKPEPEHSTKTLPSPHEKTKEASPKDNGKERKLLIIAIASSTVATFAILSLFLICFIRIKKRRRESNGGQSDGRLLSTGNYSTSYSSLVPKPITFLIENVTDFTFFQVLY